MKPQNAASGDIYVDCQKLMPADILLTAQQSAVSMAIRRFTGGPFSHAALVLEKTVLLEATLDGTGYTQMFCARLEYPTPSHGVRQLHLLPSSTTRALVLRRGGMTGVTLDRLSALSAPFLWQQYPELATTASVIDNLQMKTTGAALLRLHARYDKRSPRNPGLFCSQLVAAIFEALNSPLIPGVAAERFSPNRILRAGLEEVTEALTQPDPSAEIDETKREFINKVMMLPFSREVLPGLVEFRARVEELKRRAEQES